MQQELDTPTKDACFECGKRSLDCGGLARAALAARHRSHLQSGAHHDSRFVPKKGRQARLSFADTLLGEVKGDALELDELVIRFRFKRRYLSLWIAVSRLTRQVIGFWIGDRSFKSLWTLWFSLPAPYRRKLVYSDFYEAYAKLFRAWQHRPSGKGSGQTCLVRV